MTYSVQQFSGGTDGTALTTLNSGYDLVNPSGGAGFTYSVVEANMLTGGTVGRITAAAGTPAEGRFIRGAAQAGSQQLVFRIPAPPTSSVMDFMQTRGTVQHSGMRYHTDGTFRVLNLGTEITGLANVDVSPYVGALAVVDLTTQQGDDATKGRIRARLRIVDEVAETVGAAVWTYDSGATRNVGINGTDTITSYRAGKITAAAVLAAGMVLHGHAADDGTADWLPDPEYAVAAPVAQVYYSPDGVTVLAASLHYSPDGVTTVELI